MRSDEATAHGAIAMTLLSAIREARTMRNELSMLPLSSCDEMHLVEMLNNIEQKACRIYELCTTRSH